MVFVPPPNTLVLAPRNLSQPPEDKPPEDPWEAVAKAAAKSEQGEGRSGVCSKCTKPVSLDENGLVKVHFPTVQAIKPCVGSWKKP